MGDSLTTEDPRDHLEEEAYQDHQARPQDHQAVEEVMFLEVLDGPWQ